MNIAKQIIWFFFTLFILAYSGWYFVNFETAVKLDNETLSSTIDTTVTQLTVRQFNSEGVLTNLLTTPMMQHIPKGDIHFFQSPHVVIVQEDEPSWDISAETAKSFAGGTKIVFKRKVVVHQNLGEKSEQSTLKTEEVTYFPKEKRATTNLFVTYQQPGNYVESTGMNAYLDEKRVELLHQARGSYAPDNG